VNHIADIELVDSHPEGIRSNNYLHARRRGWQRGKDEKREEQTEKNEKREEHTVTTIYIKAISPSLSRP
jgi:hypothetical protein